MGVECSRAKVDEVLKAINADEVEPIEAYRTLLEENCFAQAKIYRVEDRYVVYLKDEERACIEYVGDLEKARSIARSFVESVCGGGYGEEASA